VSAPHLAKPVYRWIIAGNIQSRDRKQAMEHRRLLRLGGWHCIPLTVYATDPRRLHLFSRVPSGMVHENLSGTFHVSYGHRRGPVRIDSQNRWHFVWEGTGEHYFFNGTTAYFLMGWQDEKVIESSIERLHQWKINRMRVTVAGRTNLYYGEPIMDGPSWSPFNRPWQAWKGVHYLHILGRIGQRPRFGWRLD